MEKYNPENLKALQTLTRYSYKNGFKEAKKELALIIEERIKYLEEKALNRHMNDLEYGAYSELNELLYTVNELEMENIFH